MGDAISRFQAMGAFQNLNPIPTFNRFSFLLRKTYPSIHPSIIYIYKSIYVQYPPKILQRKKGLIPPLLLQWLQFSKKCTTLRTLLVSLSSTFTNCCWFLLFIYYWRWRVTLGCGHFHFDASSKPYSRSFSPYASKLHLSN